MNKNRVIKLTKKLIAFNTSTPSGLEACQTFIREWCEEVGLVCTTIPGTQALYIQTNPSSQKEFAFVCHLDVVPAAGWTAAFQPRIKNNFLYGRGAVDDKGPLAICLETLLHFRSLSEINVSCLITNDEEVENLEIEAVLKQQIFKPNFCLVADGGAHTVFDIGQKGIISLTATITTTGGHSAFEEVSESASLLLLQFIQNLKTYAEVQDNHPSFKPTLINVSRIVSETVPYALPPTATANLEIQFPPPQTLKQWLSVLNKQKKLFKALELEIKFTEVPHLVTDKQTLALINEPQHTLMTVGGVNLAKNLNKAGIQSVGHCPVTEYMGHCENEHIHLSDFDQGVKEYITLVNKWRTRS